MKNEFATISTKGECEVKKLPISRQTYDAYVTKMKEIAKNNDAETAHFAADFLLMDFLEELGCKEIVEVFCDVEKWYS